MWLGATPKRSAQQATSASPVGVVSSAGGKPSALASSTPRRRAICVLLAAVHHALIQGESLRTVPATGLV
jgi:hypothetical protein